MILFQRELLVILFSILKAISEIFLLFIFWFLTIKIQCINLIKNELEEPRPEL